MPFFIVPLFIFRILGASVLSGPCGECTCIEAGPWLSHVTEGWTKLKTVARVVSKVDRKGKKSEETRYFLSSLPCDAETIAQLVREHWRIENTLHWSLEVVSKEDDSRIRTDNSLKNLFDHPKNCFLPRQGKNFKGTFDKKGTTKVHTPLRFHK